jgi:hypothetical protein
MVEQDRIYQPSVYIYGLPTTVTIDARATILDALLSLLPQPRNNYTLHLHQKLNDINNP